MYFGNYYIQILGISLVLPSLVYGFVKSRFTREVNLPAPTIDTLTLFDPSDITISWSPVKSENEEILGYKVRLWEQEHQNRTILKTAKGKEYVVEDIKNPKKEKLMEYRIARADQSELTVHGLKLDTPYMIEVLAYNANGDGPPSPSSGIEIHST